MVSQLWLGLWSGIAMMWGVPTATVALLMAFLLALIVGMFIGLWAKSQTAGLVSVFLFFMLETFLGFVDWIVFIVIFIIMAGVYLVIPKG